MDGTTWEGRATATRRGLRGAMLLLACLFLAACAAPPPDKRWSTILPEEVFFLEFDDDGELVDPAEFFRMRRQLAEGDVDRLLVLSLGWSYDRATALQGYRDLLLHYMDWLGDEQSQVFVRSVGDGVDRLELPPGWGVACVVWDSRSTGVTTFLRDLIPGSTVADVVGKVPDMVLFPFTFWAKAGKANKISYSLVRHLDALFGSLPSPASAAPPSSPGASPGVAPGASPGAAEAGSLDGTLGRAPGGASAGVVGTASDGAPGVRAVEPPELYLVGHSFGCRVINSVVASATRGEEHVTFEHADRVRGALYIQPAMTFQEMPKRTSMPAVVTQSRHDHANGVLFPVANIIGNTFGMSLWLSWSDSFKRGDVDARVRRLFAEEQGVAVPDDLPPAAGEHPWDVGLRVLAEAGGMLAGILTSVPVAALSWGRGQLYELGTRHVNYPFDTLAQVPLVEGLVAKGDELLWTVFGWRPHWGARHKGLFDFGPLVESIGRMDYPGLLPLQQLNAGTEDLFDETEAFDFARAERAGVHLVRADRVIREGWSDYEPTWPDATYGILDVIGAHNDFRKPAIYRLVQAVMSL